MTGTHASVFVGHPLGGIIYFILTAFAPDAIDELMDRRHRTNIRHLAAIMNNEPPKTLQEYQDERRRQRWGYFLTPVIAMGSIVFSIALLMFFGKSCQDRILADAPFRTNPLFKQYAPLLDKDSAAGDAPGGEKRPANQGEKSEGTSPSQ
ncbi:MAG: hypothetical protein WD688_27470 [Candidatus Binatia bacterium]